MSAISILYRYFYIGHSQVRPCTFDDNYFSLYASKTIFSDKMYEFIDNVLKLGIQYVKDRVNQDDRFAFEKIES